MKHPTMQNQPLRYALLCLAARLLLINIQDTFPSFQSGLLSPAIAILTIINIALVVAAYWTVNGWRIERRQSRGT